MSDFELYITESNEEDLLAIEDLQEFLVTQIPESTKATISRQNSTSLNTIKTVTLAGAFMLHFSIQNPIQAQHYIHFGQESPDQLLTELCDYDKNYGSSDINAITDVDYVMTSLMAPPKGVDFSSEMGSIDFASRLFEGIKPMTGKELDSVNKYYNKIKQSDPTLPNRL